MTLTWYPKNVLMAVPLLAAFGTALDLAIDFEQGAAVGALALVAYLILDVTLTFNPAHWWGARRPRA